MRLRRSKISFTRLRATRKMSRTSRIRLRLMSRKKTMLLDCDGLSRKSGSRVWSTAKTANATAVTPISTASRRRRRTSSGGRSGEVSRRF